MTDHAQPALEFDFELDPKSTYEGMLLGGQRVYRGRGRLVLYGLYFECFVLAPLGCIALYVIGASMLWGELPEGVHWIFLASLPGFLIGRYLNESAYRRLARMICQSKFGRAGHMRFDAEGLSVKTEASLWQTGWRDVEEVLIGKHCISIAISGIVLILPLSAFENKADMQRTHKTLNSMFDHGRTAQ